MTDTPAASTSETEDRPWDDADQLEADLEAVEYAAFLAMYGAIETMRDLPGMDNRSVDIEDPVFGSHSVALRLAPYDYPYAHLREADVLLSVDRSAEEKWSLTAHSGQQISVDAAAGCLGVPSERLEQAIGVLVPGLQAALTLWQDRSPELLAAAERYAGRPRGAGAHMDRLVDRIRRCAYSPITPSDGAAPDPRPDEGQVISLADRTDRSES